MKRVVTGEKDGRAVFANVTEVADVEPLIARGMKIWGLWGVDGTPQLPYEGTEPDHAGGFYPPPGHVRVTLISFPPDEEVEIDPDAGDEVTVLLDDEGTHATPTMDVGWIISGELGLQLGEGEIQWLTQGDVVVQNGTIHRWHNRSGNPALTGWVVVGADTAGSAGR